jgi:demethylmenaquinone methyltransferase/2-methoxy-6-polyprenyl-1,4-benzoquinol methylase
VTDRTSKFVQKTFTTEVSKSYELVNRLLTFGQDVVWRRRAAREAASYGGERWADVCTGTGEMAMYLRRLAPEGVRVYAFDFSLPMMTEAIRKPEASGIGFAASDVKRLPLQDNCLDLITISFATRNINLSREVLVETFAEFHRVLRPGGRFVNLETSQPRSAVIRRLFHAFVKLLVRPIGTAISGSSGAYRYLSQTIPRFYGADELSEIMSEAGFTDVSYRTMMFGAAAIHQGVKDS